MPDAADIQVVGAGVAGLSLACALAENGFRVAVFDAAPCPEAPELGSAIEHWDLRVSALTPASIAFLQALSVWEGIAAARVAPYDAMHVWDARGSGRIDFHAAECNAEYLGQVVENRLTIQALLKRLQRLSGVSLHWQSELAEMHWRAGAWHLTFADGSGSSAGLTVAADGARSRVRALAAVPTRDWTYHQSAIVGTVRLAEGHQSACWQSFCATGPVAILPLADPHYAALVWSLDDDLHASMSTLGDDDFVSALNRAMAPYAPPVAAIGPRASFPLRQSHAVDYVDEGLVLVADAAHNIHPLAGQGINLGLSDVRALSGELIRARAAGLPPSSAVPLRRYQRKRKTENLAMMAAMEGFKRGFASEHPAAVMARNAGLNFVDQQAWLKQWFVRRAMG